MPNNRREKRRIVVTPYRSSSEQLPKPIKSHRVCFFECGNDYDESKGRWTLFVDIISGNPDLVDYIRFKFSTGEAHDVYRRTPLTLSDGLDVNRFSLERAAFPLSRKFTIILCGRGGSRHSTGFNAKPYNFRGRSLLFYEWRRLRSSYISAPDIDFGVELEMSCRVGTPHKELADRIAQRVNVPTKVELSYQNVHDPFKGWKLVHDGSITCSVNSPDCSKYELVSPVLNGESGLNQCKKVLGEIKAASDISVNKSMGFHVHVSVDKLGLEHIKNVCLNFIKYEDLIDQFMPLSRRDQVYCKSNRHAIPLEGNGKKHNAIAACKNLDQLCKIMNPQNSRYFKLNLQNLMTGRQPTIEFRQHSSTGNFEKVSAWTRFCMRFVHNSVRRPKSLKHGGDAFEMLFDTVIHDIKLKDYYHRRMQSIVREEEDIIGRGTKSRDDCKRCCNNCSEGHSCATTAKKLRR